MKSASIGILLLLFIGTFSLANALPTIDENEVIDFSSYLGGTGDEHTDIAYSFGATAVDSKGNIVVGGRTTSTDFPVKDAFQENFSGNCDGTLSKFYPNGSLIFSTYFGGVNQEQITDLAFDAEDNIIIAGTTGSPDLPVVNAFKSNGTGVSENGVDGFIAKFSEDGQTLLYCTYFGGDGHDFLYTVNVDTSGRIAISGTTESTDLPLLNPTQAYNAGGLDIFVALLDTGGQSLLFSTYIGTPGIDHGRRVAFDSLGNVLLTGICWIGDLATDGAYQEVCGGGSADAFLAKFNATGNLEYFTFLGGEAIDWGNDLVIDSDDNVVITGFTTSDDFPVSNPYQGERAGYADMFVSKFTPDGQSLVFSTYFGGSSPDYGNGVIIGNDDCIQVIGQTESTDFPRNCSFGTSDSSHDNMTLVFLTPEGSLTFSMVFGGEDDDVGINTAWYSDDTYIILGYTDSTDFPTRDAYQDTIAGGSDMILMKLDLSTLLEVPSTTSTTTTTTTSQTGGLPLGLIGGTAVVAIVVVVALLVLLRKRSG